MDARGGGDGCGSWIGTDNSVERILRPRMPPLPDWIDRRTADIYCKDARMRLRRFDRRAGFKKKSLRFRGHKDDRSGGREGTRRERPLESLDGQLQQNGKRIDGCNEGIDLTEATT